MKTCEKRIFRRDPDGGTSEQKQGLQAFSIMDNVL
jgi:hypothetical protein